MQIVNLDPAWEGLIDRAWVEELDATPFLRQCRAGTVSRSALRSFVVQHHHYARHFTRYLCALMGALTGERDRLDLADNLFEELGLDHREGDAPPVTHAELYRTMMRRLGVDATSEPVAAATQELIETMLESCRSADALEGLGALCLGAEAIVPHVYSQIIKGFVSHGTAPATLDFFYLHVEADDAHALTMRAIIDRELKGSLSEAKRAVLRTSAKRAIAARTDFFASIVQEAVVPVRRVVNDVHV